MNLSKNQLTALSKYFGDISKLIFAAAVLGFFIQIGPEPIPLRIFAGGFIVTIVSFLLSIRLAK